MIEEAVAGRSSQEALLSRPSISPAGLVGPGPPPGPCDGSCPGTKGSPRVSFGFCSLCQECFQLERARHGTFCCLQWSWGSSRAVPPALPVPRCPAHLGAERRGGTLLLQG